ncbi:BTAD domain-containing putative transcriptional regulator [Streptomyces europaeiscabiei]|uniref:BTAD domain-containing putative transcriptional regulator n=1 Tax=Streptomyces europaeiscabiei TaxID=146819 RepID=UPI0029B60F99|nr:BTAD domain-containing putative transcriptional regulator [Streptomyces europaeiscabiei]MDX3847138.1 BTAD domain-containing putative transcriptional regulator [Streptomyces europaeiscabiei]
MGRTPEQLGAWLRARRVHLGLSQTQLAEQAGVSTRGIREIERGRAPSPRSRSVLRLIAVLGLEAESASGAEPRGGDVLRVGVLGPLTLRVAGETVDVGSAKQQGLLGLLALQPGLSIPQDEIVDILWDACPPATCLNLVHTYVARLRRTLAPANQTGQASDGVLRRTRIGYLLQLAEGQSDAVEFTELAARASAAKTLDETFRQSGEGLRLCRGAVLGGAPHRVREHPSAVALTRQWMSLVQSYADAALELGRAAEALPELQKAAGLDPLHEGVHARIMLALAASGQQAAALTLFGALRTRLDDQLGVTPGPEVTEAHMRILRMDLPRPAAAAPPPAISLMPPALLPYDVPFFTGRDEQLDRLDALLVEHGTGICALTGAAGVGKTALAVHWAHRVRDRFPDGQLFVDLRGHSPAAAPLRPVEALVRFLLALGVAGERIPDTPEAAADLYRTLAAERRMMVVLDNAVDVDQIRPLLPGGPGCLVLVTSRSRLAGLAVGDGARRLPVDVFGAEESRLLLARTLGRARVDAEPEAAAALADACGHLPLALRISAANLDHTPRRALRDQADELCAGDRLGLLSVDGDDRSAVRAAFSLSYHALPAPVRRMFRLLALAPGPDIGVMATAVLTDTTPREASRLLERLSAAHLLREHSPGRYRCHDLLMLYAAERLQLEETRTAQESGAARLYAWLLAGVNRCARLLYPGTQRMPGADEEPGGVPAPLVTLPDLADASAAARWLDIELPGLAATVHRAAAEGHQAAWQLADGLRGCSWTRKHAVDWLAVGGAALAAARHAGQPLAEAAMHNLLGDAHVQQGLPDSAIAHYERLLVLAEAAGWLDGAATAHNNISTVAQLSGRLRLAAEHLDHAMELDRRNGLPEGHPVVLGNLGHTLRDLGRLREALDCYRRADELLPALGSRMNQLLNTAVLAELHHLLGESAQARHLLDIALPLAQEVGDLDTEAFTLRLAARIRCDTGDLTGALAAAGTAAALSDEDGDEHSRATAQLALGGVLLAVGRRDEATTAYQEALALARKRGAHDIEARSLLGLASVLAPTDRRRAAAALDLARRSEYRLVEDEALTVLARCGLEHGEPAVAVDYGRQALAAHRTSGYRKGQAETLDILGRAAATMPGADPVPYWTEALEILDALGAPEATALRHRIAGQE